MSKRSQFAVDASRYLSGPSIQQIIGFLRTTARHGSGLLTLGEHEELVTTARGLERILEWQDEKVTKHD